MLIFRGVYSPHYSLIGFFFGSRGGDSPNLSYCSPIFPNGFPQEHPLPLLDTPGTRKRTLQISKGKDRLPTTIFFRGHSLVFRGVSTSTVGGTSVFTYRMPYLQSRIPNSPSKRLEEVPLLNMATLRENPGKSYKPLVDYM